MNFQLKFEKKFVNKKSVLVMIFGKQTLYRAGVFLLLRAVLCYSTHLLV